jgi:hypothetical protein
MSRSRPRTPVTLSESIHRQLNTYALAATAAGVGMLALTPSAEAKIVYTPAHVKVALQSPYGIDLDHNGTADIYLGRGAQEGFSYVFASANPKLGNGVAGTSAHGDMALALLSGANIGAFRKFYANSFQPEMGAVYLGGSIWYGPWANKGKGLKDRYLGIKFKSGGRFHYGWARVTVATGEDQFSSLLLTGYAYETIPGKAIIAGQTKGADDIPEGPDAALTEPTPDPGTLGALALGAPGLSIWRREEESIGL